MWVQVLLSPQIFDDMTIEEKVSAAILEKPIAVLEINGTLPYRRSVYQHSDTRLRDYLNAPDY